MKKKFSSLARSVAVVTLSTGFLLGAAAAAEARDTSWTKARDTSWTVARDTSWT